MSPNRLKIVSFLAISLASAYGHAADFSYTWLEGGLMRITPGINGVVDPSESTTISGKFIDGSWAMSDHWSLSAGYDYAKQGPVLSCNPSNCQPAGGATLTETGATHDLHELRGGLTFHEAIGEDLQWLTSIEYVHAAYFAFGALEPICVPSSGPCVTFVNPEGSSNATAIGYGFSAGLRWQPWDSWEFDGRVGHLRMNAGPATPLDEGTDYGLIGDGSSNFVEANAAWNFTAHWALRLGDTHLSTPHNRYTLGLRYSF